jgi:signal transduction histidine kinase
MVTGRKIELQQSFAHLVTNSFEYGKIGETSWMTIKVSQESEGKIKILFTDSGPGIDKGMKDKIFEPFFSTRLPQKTGLGLSIARSILEAHEGTISLVPESENTSFEIILSQSLKEGAP